MPGTRPFSLVVVSGICCSGATERLRCGDGCASRANSCAVQQLQADRPTFSSRAYSFRARDHRSCDIPRYDTGNRTVNEEQVFHASGRIIADNVYGTIEEDAWRRDFTVNALYYNIADYSIWAFADGLADLQSRQLRLIGDPGTRYTEDPVRMLRAARFAAKLGFDLHPEAVAPIPGDGVIAR